MTRAKRQRGRLFGLFVFALICAAIFIALLSEAGGLHLGSTYDFEAVVPDAQQLITNSDVRDAGVDIGRVTGIATSGDDAVVSVAIKSSDGPIYRNATVQTRTKTLIGESYLDVDPGTADAGAIPNGGVLPLARAKDSVQLDQILSALTPVRRVRLQRLLTGLGDGLAGVSGQNLNATVGALSSAVENAAPVAETLAVEQAQTPVLVSDLGDVFSALGQQSTALQGLIKNGLGAADAVADQRRALSTGLGLLPSTLTTARTTLARLAGVGTEATPVLNNLTTTLNDLGPAVRGLPGASAATLAALHRLHAATPAVDALLASLKGAAPALTQLVPSLDVVERQLRPAVAELAPYSLDLGSMLAGLDGEGSYHDANGEYARVVEVVADSTLVDLPSSEQMLLAELAKIGTVQLIAKSGINAYPAPDTAADPQAMTTRYPQVDEDPPAGTK
jgi:phospholipid/cholesterol/gamma-HCH transport system substrate-binding protein